MKRFVPPLISLLMVSAHAETWVDRPEWRRHFEARSLEGTFVLFEPGTGRWSVLDMERARKGYLPASTFKIPNALIGLETGAIADGDEVFRWDGSPRPYASWERDHTLATGMRDSVVWMFQEVARRIGKRDMREWLTRFDYGNHDITGGVDLFWLQGSLRISAVQQVEFLRKLEEGRLPVTQRSRQLVRNAILVEQTRDYTLRAKTGTSDRSEGGAHWWVGWVEKGGRPVAYFAMNHAPARVSRDERMAVSRAILREGGWL